MISPLAYVDPEAKLGKNVTVLPFAYIEKNVEIGDDCIITSSSKIEHSCLFSACAVSKLLPKGFSTIIRLQPPSSDALFNLLLQPNLYA